jgi:hypothetical protein
MKLVLASYFEEENHGSGRKIGISPGKPKDLIHPCPYRYEKFSPDPDEYWEYHKNKKTDYEAAAVKFRDSYQAKLDAVIKEARERADAEGVDVIDIFPFEDGDTLLSWERKGNMTYRTMLADYLRDLGYDVEEN